MEERVIKVSGVRKEFALRAGRASYATLRESLMNAFTAPFGRSAANDQTFAALQDVAFEVRKGEIVGIIGANGAGKSTLLKILSRITEPTAGRVEITGRVASLLEVGTGFHPELTGRENIYLNGAILGMSKAEIESKFEEIVEFSGVRGFLDMPVKRYSTGMRVRLAFAVAAHIDPEILIIDEVLAVGDAEFQKKCLGKMGSVARAGRTVLFVSHNLGAVQSLCGRAMVLEAGRVVFNGETNKAIDRYLGSQVNSRRGFAETGKGHPGRPGAMPSLIRSVGLLGAEGDERYRDTVRTGEDLVFEIVYDTGGWKLDFAVLAVNTLMDERVLTAATLHGKDLAGPIKGRGTLVCRLPAAPLAQGTYRVLAALGDTPPARNVDVVDNALTFHVEMGGYFDGLTGLHPGQGNVAQKSRWEDRVVGGEE